MIINTGEEVNQGGYALLNVTVSGNNNDGGTVTVTGTNATYTGTTDNNGQCSILIYEPDTYSVSYVKSTDTSDTQSVTIGFGGATYSVSLTMLQVLTIIINTPIESMSQSGLSANVEVNNVLIGSTPITTTFNIQYNTEIYVPNNHMDFFFVYINSVQTIKVTISEPGIWVWGSILMHRQGSSDTSTYLTVDPGDTIIIDSSGYYD